MTLTLNTFSNLVRRCLTEFVALGADDVFVQTLPTGNVRVECVIAGKVHRGFRVNDRTEAARLTTELKVIAGFDPESRQMQSGRFSIDDPEVDYRVTTLPVHGGEHIALRVLRRNIRFDLDRYPMPDGARASLKRALQRKQGIIVLSGPSCSGKTRLMHEALATLNDGTRPIYTIENPIELVVPGLRQTEVSEDTPSAALLQAILRQSAQVVMIGEVCDSDTARLAIEAAKSGHLVLTTVAAGRVDSVMARWVGLGANPDDVYEHLLFASTQRLVPYLCSDCRQPDREAAQQVEQETGVRTRAFRSPGCSNCDRTGQRGRVLLMGWEGPDEERRTLREEAFAALDKGWIDHEGLLSCL